MRTESCRCHQEGIRVGKSVHIFFPFSTFLPSIPPVFAFNYESFLAFLLPSFGYEEGFFFLCECHDPLHVGFHLQPQEKANTAM